MNTPIRDEQFYGPDEQSPDHSKYAPKRPRAAAITTRRSPLRQFRADGAERVSRPENGGRVRLTS